MGKLLSTDCSKAVLLLPIVVCVASVVSYVAFCVVRIRTPSLPLLVPQEGCAS